LIWFGLHKIFVYFGAIVQESTIYLSPPLICMTHPSLILLHEYNTVYDSLFGLPFVRYTQYKIGSNNIVLRPRYGVWGRVAAWLFG